MSPRHREKETYSINKLAEWAIVAIGTIVSYVIAQGVSHIQTMGVSVQELNRNLAVIVERIGTHEKLLSRHEQEIESLKTKR